MVLFNYSIKAITAKVVYYGPGLCGKTTNLQYIHGKMNPESRGKLLSLATETDRTLFFDFLPMNLGKIRGFHVRFQLYTVPGQVYYNATRRLVLKGADAVVFVADSQKEMLGKNLESLENLNENLRANGLDPDTIPLVIQYNKRDLPNIMEIGELNGAINLRDVPFQSAIAVTGEGVLETFKLVTRELMQALRSKHDIRELKNPEGDATPLSGMSEAGSKPSSPRDTVPERRGERTSEDVPFPGSSDGTAGSLEETIGRLCGQVRKMEQHLNSLLERDEAIQRLLSQIKEKLDVGGEDPIPLPGGKTPVLPEGKKAGKKGFFWNR